MASNLRRSKRTVGKRINDLHSRVAYLQKRPAPRRIGKRVITTTQIVQNAVTAVEIAPGAVDITAIDPGIAASIETAQETADTAQSTADGKNKIYRQTFQPPGTAYAEGDLWFDTDDGNKFYRFTTGAWTAFTLGNNAIASINATKITAGSLDAGVIVTSNLDAGQITTGTLSSIVLNNGTPVAGLYPFAVDASGNMRATSATITGSISGSTITGGSVSGTTVTGGTITSGNFDGSGDGLRLTGGFIKGSGTGVRILNYVDDVVGATALFRDSIYTNVMYPNSVVLSGDMPITLATSQSRFQNTITNATTATIRMDREYYGTGHGTAGSDGANFMVFFRQGDGTVRGRIGFATGLNPTSVQFQDLSDSRLKQVVDKENDALAIINGLNPKYFKWLDGDEDAEPTFGLFAQEAHKVAPSAVSVGSSEDISCNKETGNYDVENPWMISYSTYIPYLIGAIKELSTKVAELESKM